MPRAELRAPTAAATPSSQYHKTFQACVDREAKAAFAVFEKDSAIRGLAAHGYHFALYNNVIVASNPNLRLFTLADELQHNSGDPDRAPGMAGHGSPLAASNGFC
jgi:hypothetical protein